MRKRQILPEFDEPRLDISSIIDVSFLLLIFFLVTSTIVPRENDLDMDLPPPGVGELPDPPMIIRVEEDGEIRVNPERENEVLVKSSDPSLSLLKDRLELLRAVRGAQASVIVEAADISSYQRFIDVVNCLAGVGISKVSIRDLLD